MIGLFFSSFISLFSVVNPLGAVPVFLSMTRDQGPRELIWIVRRASVMFVLILVVSFFAGSFILHFFGISLEALRIAGGMIILRSGFALLNGQGGFNRSRSIDKQVKKEAIVKNDISLTPLAIPMLAGPGSISLMITMFTESAHWWQYLIISISILTTGIVTYFILRLAPKIAKVLGVSGLNSVSKIMGFIVMSIGVQYIINGITVIFPRVP